MSLRSLTKTPSPGHRGKIQCPSAPPGRNVPSSRRELSPSPAVTQSALKLSVAQALGTSALRPGVPGARVALSRPSAQYLAAPASVPASTPPPEPSPSVRRSQRIADSTKHSRA